MIAAFRLCPFGPWMVVDQFRIYSTPNHLSAEFNPISSYLLRDYKTKQCSTVAGFVFCRCSSPRLLRQIPLSSQPVSSSLSGLYGALTTFMQFSITAAAPAWSPILPSMSTIMAYRKRSIGAKNPPYTQGRIYQLEAALSMCAAQNVRIFGLFPNGRWTAITCEHRQDELQRKHWSSPSD
jgi:hypothetical protein